jgi:hypothetical protein
MPETTLAIEDAPLKSGDFTGTLMILGKYNITGVNNTSLDQNFSADLKIHQQVLIILDVTDHGIYGNIEAADALYEILPTVLYKAKSFRNPGCEDSLHFDPYGMIEFRYLPSWDSASTPTNKKFYIRSLDDIARLINFDPLPDYSSYIKNKQNMPLFDLSLGSSLMYCYNKTKEIFSSCYSEESTSKKILGRYRIIGTSDVRAKHNEGFNATLTLDHKINYEFTHNSSKDKDHLNNLLSTALFKAKAFRNKQCFDAVKFYGEITIHEDGNPVKTFVINDLSNFESFVDYMSHLSLPSLVATAELPQKSSELKQVLSEPLISRDHKDQNELDRNRVADCCTKLRNICV